MQRISHCPKAIPATLKVVILAAACLAITAEKAGAIPRPLSPEELAMESDLVAQVRVLGVACTAVTIDELVGQKLPTYQAWLLVLKVEKGNVKAKETILVNWREIPTGPKAPIGAAPPVRYLPGEEVKTHLKWDNNGKVYLSTSYNAKGKPTKKPAKIALPKAAGRVVYAPASPRKGK